MGKSPLLTPRPVHFPPRAPPLCIFPFPLTSNFIINNIKHYLSTTADIRRETAKHVHRSKIKHHAHLQGQAASRTKRDTGPRPEMEQTAPQASQPQTEHT